MIRRVRVLDVPGQQVNESNSHVITMNINIGDKFTLLKDNARKGWNSFYVTFI